MDGAVSVELEYSPDPARIDEWVREAYGATARLLREAGAQELNMSRRADWDEYFMRIAVDVVSSRSTCDRKHVGALIVRDRNILSTGYNGSDLGAPALRRRRPHHGEWPLHRARSTRNRTPLSRRRSTASCIDGASIYTTASPCWNCFKLIVNSGMRDPLRRVLPR